eukprot:CAMPEP_0182472432 /NCGR_PEP_ID=MMETSP1319-20130603/22134_1 /TAXON_ID=172717 /ORGANISM="Bolidomonas pacifica, Strain RCC208" /LENGTH=81 /DNA_ID=CAMNT_0024673113 /DNA_START=195 /DNA_END=436 /DNA_ORIENTATION=+
MASKLAKAKAQRLKEESSSSTSSSSTSSSSSEENDDDETTLKLKRDFEYMLNNDAYTINPVDEDYEDDEYNRLQQQRERLS